MRDDTIHLEDVVGLVRRNLVASILLVAICAAVALTVAFLLPKRYKTQSRLSIASSYFKQPLVSDFISEVTDPSEVNAQRQALLRLALNDEFLDQLGTKYGYYTSTPDTPLRTTERELLLKRIQYYPLNASEFQISIAGTDPKGIYEMTKEVLTQMTNTLFLERYRTFVAARDAIQNELKSLRAALKQIKTRLPSDDELELKKQLEKLDAGLGDIRSRYTATHPEVVQLTRQRDVLRRRLEQAQGTKQTPTTDENEYTPPFGAKEFTAPVDMFNVLLKRLGNLNLLIDLERDNKLAYLRIVEPPALPGRAFFPDKRLFLAGGIAVGTLLSVILATFRELRRNSVLTAEEASEILGVPFLGELPSLATPNAKLLLDGPRSAQRALPPGARG